MTKSLEADRIIVLGGLFFVIGYTLHPDCGQFVLESFLGGSAVHRLVPGAVQIFSFISRALFPQP